MEKEREDTPPTEANISSVGTPSGIQGRSNSDAGGTSGQCSEPQVLHDENSVSSVSSLYDGFVPFGASENRRPKNMLSLLTTTPKTVLRDTESAISCTSQQSSIAFQAENQQGRMSYHNEPNGGQGAMKFNTSVAERTMTYGDGYRSAGMGGSYYRSIPILQREPQTTLDNDPITYHIGASNNNARFLDGISCDLAVGDECRFCCEGLFNWRGRILSVDDSDARNVVYYGDFSALPHWVPMWNDKPYPRHKISKYFKEDDTSDLDRCLVRGHPLTHILSNRNRLKKGVVVLLCDGTKATVYYNDPICWRIGVKIDVSSRVVHRLTYLKVVCINPTTDYLANYCSPQLAVEKAEEAPVRKRPWQSAG